MAGDVDHVVDTAANPVIPFMITASSVTGELTSINNTSLVGSQHVTHVVPLIHIEICVHKPLMCPPDCAGHAGEWLLDRKNALDIISVFLLASYGVDDGWFDTEEREGSAARLCGSDASHGRNDVRSSLRLPVRLQVLLVTNSASERPPDNTHIDNV